LDSSFRVLGNLADAEDVAQEVFMEIFRAGRIEQHYDQPALMRSIAVRRSIDRLRARKRHPAFDTTQLTSREPCPSEHVKARELEELLRSELRKMSPREAEIFCLSAFENMNNQSIATALRLTTNSVAKHLSTAKKKLSKLIDTKELETKHE
jgi:RNA polymerase sigma-70 factor, ECF subfamily